MDFTLPSAVDDTIVSLSAYTGKVVLINFWRTSCEFSQRETPRLVGLYNDNKTRGFGILGVSDDTSDSVEQVPAYLSQTGASWPVGLNDQGEFIEEFSEIEGTPTNWLVSRGGALTPLKLDRTSEDWQHLVENVVRALDEPVPTSSAIKPRGLVTAPPFSLPDLTGKTLRLESFSGRPLVVNFFTADSSDWAGAVLSAMHREYAPRGLQIVGINLFDEEAGIRECMQRHDVTYPILRGDGDTQHTWLGDDSGWAVFFITADGRILKKIPHSIENGIEAWVFPKYAEFLLNSETKGSEDV